MAKIAPFRGLRYNLKQIADPAKVMAPPYDVISPELQEDLYRRHPANLVRLILGKISDSDNETDNRYIRAAAEFEKWQQEQILVRDPEPSIYLYEQQFHSEGGELVTRKGIMALARLEDFSSGVVKPHEKTLTGPKGDRFNLTKACAANLSPIFSVYSDPCCVLDSVTKRLKDAPADLQVKDDEGVLHRLWQVSDPMVIDKAHDLLDNKPLFIADGHHRYEAALSYRNYMREKHPGYSGKELFNYVLMYFANMDEGGIQILPTHRLVFDLEGFSLDSLLESLRGFFEVETRPLDPKSAEARRQVRQELKEKGRERHCLAMYAGGDEVHYLTLLDKSVMDRFFSDKSPKVLRTLDVSILHRLILETLLNISPEAQEKQANLRFVKNFDEPFERVQGGEFQLAFLMNPSRMSDVRDVANAGEKMPQKSTYFYPKLLSGLVINKIVEGEKVED